MGKNNHIRSPQISREEESLRWDLAYGKITPEQFEAGIETLREQGKIYLRPRYKLQKGTDD